MTTLDLLKKLYLIRDIIHGCYNTQSDVFSYVQGYQHKESVLAFSANFRGLLTRYRPVFEKDPNDRLTTRFALYLEAFMELHQGNLKPMLEYLERHEDVKRFLWNHWGTLERLYYDFKGQDNDLLLLEEYSLLLDKNYQVIKVDLINDDLKMNQGPFKNEFLYGFFQRVQDKNDLFLGRNQQEKKKFIETIESFLTCFHI